MAIRMPKITKSSVMDGVRDGSGLIATTALSESVGLLGALGSIWLAPQIAKTPGGRIFNRMWAIFMSADKFLELVTGGKGVV